MNTNINAVQLASKSVKIPDSPSEPVSLAADHYWSGRKGKSIIYVDIPTPEQLGMMDQPPYGSKKGDGSAEDLLWKRFNKLELKTQRAVIQAYHDEIAQAYGVKPELLTYGFSRKAGCSCGCSPGWLPQVVDPVTKRKSRLSGRTVVSITGMNAGRRAYLDGLKSERERRQAEQVIGAGI
jgi:hypothetical protein